VAFWEALAFTVLGAVLAEAAAWWARREERDHVRRERVQERQRKAVEGLHDALDAAHAKLPGITAKGLGADEYWAAQREWQDGWFLHASYVRDRELLTRYDAAGWAILTVALDLQHGFGGDDWVVQRAISNARAACIAYVLEEPLPPALFPPRGEAGRMVRASPKGRDWAALHEWLENHPQAEREILTVVPKSSD
jgi:hypothetical protein